MDRSRHVNLMEIYERLLTEYGHHEWWPGDAVEVLIGAILTQRTAWRNVEAALTRLRECALLGIDALARADLEDISAAIRTAGFYRQKAAYLREACRRIVGDHGGLDALLSLPTSEARSYLLSLRGIGPETADSILLYAGDHPTFVVDAYTMRIFGRLGVHLGSYEDARGLFMKALPTDVGLYREYHALIVEHGKRRCRTAPVCDGCPLLDLCRNRGGDGINTDVCGGRPGIS